MKTCKVGKNIVLIYFFGILLSIISLNSHLTQANLDQIDNPEEGLHNNTIVENINDNSQEPNLASNQNSSEYNPLSFSLENSDIEFAQELKEIDGSFYSNHFYFQDKFNFTYQDLLSMTDFDLTLNATSTFDFEVILISARTDNLVLDQQSASHTQTEHSFNFKSIQEPFYIQIQALGESFSIQELLISPEEQVEPEANPEPPAAPEANPEPQEAAEEQAETEPSSEQTVSSSSSSSSPQAGSLQDTQGSSSQASQSANNTSVQVNSSSQFASNLAAFQGASTASTAHNTSTASTAHSASAASTAHNTSAASSNQSSSSSTAGSSQAYHHSDQGQTSSPGNSVNSSTESQKQQVDYVAYTDLIKEIADKEFVPEMQNFVDYTPAAQNQRVIFSEMPDIEPQNLEILEKAESDKSHIIIEESEFSIQPLDTRVLAAQTIIKPFKLEHNQNQKKHISDLSDGKNTGNHSDTNHSNQIAKSLQVDNHVKIKETARHSAVQTANETNSLSKSLQASLIVETPIKKDIKALVEGSKVKLDSQLKAPNNRLLKTQENPCKKPVCSPLNKYNEQNAEFLDSHSLILDLDPGKINQRSISNFLISGSSKHQNSRVELYVQRSSDHPELLASKLTDTKGNFYFIIDSNFQNHKQYDLFAKIGASQSPIYTLETNYQEPILQYPPGKFCGQTLESSKLQCPFDEVPSLEFNLPSHLYLEVLYNSELTAGQLAQGSTTLIQPPKEYLKTIKSSSNHKAIYIVRDKNNPELASSPVVINFRSFVPIINPISVPLFVFSTLIILYMLIQSINLKFRKNEQETFAQANIDL